MMFYRLQSAKTQKHINFRVLTTIYYLFKNTLAAKLTEVRGILGSIPVFCVISFTFKLFLFIRNSRVKCEW